MAALLLLSTAHPENDATKIAGMAVLVAFLSASQDIVIDALRIDMLQPAEYAMGAAIVTLGYRIGLLAAGAGALYLAQFCSWHVAYQVMAGLVLVGIAGMAIAPEPDIVLPRGTLREWLERSVMQPFANFMDRPRWPVIVAFILLYKLATVLGLSLTSPFYKSLGFDKAEVASVTKVLGLGATIFGGFAGAWLVGRAGIWRSLLWCGIAQALALYLFWYLSLAGHSLPVLVTAIGAENVTGAMAAMAFVTYLAALCDKRFTATQYALFTSLAALTGETLASTTGYMVDAVGWPEFFLMIPLTALPGLGLLFALKPSSQRERTN
jgi:PAT family beta-lactamase induction signal transducer AmpG